MTLPAGDTSPVRLCECGCGEPATRRFVNHHYRSTVVSPLRYVVEDAGYDSPCWTWTGARIQRGYGHISIKGKLKLAHRVSYERSVGPIPDGLELDHLCRNRACINPEHLEPVTHRENVLRGVAIRDRCPRGHLYDGVHRSRGKVYRRCLTCVRESSGRKS